MKTLELCNTVKLVKLCLLLLLFSSTVDGCKRLTSKADPCAKEGTPGCGYDSWWKPWYWYYLLGGLIGGPFVLGIIYVCWDAGCREECGCAKDEEPQAVNRTETVALTADTSEKIKCYMCFERIGKTSWYYHRRLCFKNNKAEILSFPEPYMAKCGKCEKTLKLLPQRLGSRFTCANQERGKCTLMNTNSGKSGEVVADVAVMGNDGKYEIRNTGENRFNCFWCDFDLCKECVIRQVDNPDTFVASFPPPTTKKEIAIEMEEPVPTQSDIMSFAQPLEVFCSKCGDKLRLWSKKGAAFTCSNMDKMKCALMNSSGGCPVGAVSTGDGTWRILNNGSNRFTCFSCSFDLCIQCVLRHLSNPPPSYEATVATSAPSAPAEEDAFVRKGDSSVHVQTID